ncbi:MAG: lipid-A-disaccharide synthase N-terminal domain-containing protein, partial [Pseudomonadota bacterium]
QAVFTGRFVLQWLVTERLGRSTTPVGFWYMSIAGSLILLIYAVAVQDLVIVLGQGLGLVIYGRNLVLIRRAAASGRAEN